MNSVVLDCLEDELKEAAGTELGENAYVEEVLGEDIEYDEVSSAV